MTAGLFFPDPIEELGSKSLCAKQFDRITITHARRELGRKLEREGIECAYLDARILIGHALALDHSALIRQAADVLNVDQAIRIAELGNRRLAHEPVARIVGHKEFWGLTFKLNRHTLVPRPETETLVEAALATFSDASATSASDRSKALRILDLGTGSGALLLALLSELPNAFGIGTDVDPCALECARGNALAQHARASFVACDYGSALAPQFDIVVSNPPYISTSEIARLPAEVRDFDPKGALDGGADGLDAYRTVAAHAGRLLAPAGVLVVELGHGQAEPIMSIFKDAGLAPGEPQHDLSGIPRALPARICPGFLS
jgi:release factor glutamine methyltransferase